VRVFTSAKNLYLFLLSHKEKGEKEMKPSSGLATSLDVTRWSLRPLLRSAAIVLTWVTFFCALLVGNVPKAFALSYGGGVILTGPDGFSFGATDTNFARSGILSPGLYELEYRLILIGDYVGSSLSTGNQQFSFILGGIPLPARSILSTQYSGEPSGILYNE
jgi:hypothetical protein